jgi:predicted Zn-dependent protease
MSTRREKIETMLQSDPQDTFLRYSLALEMEKVREHDRSLAILADLTREVPPYIPAYFMAAQQQTRLGKLAEARDLLREGIEAARNGGDHHAAGEMAEFLAGLGALGDA